MGKTVYDLAVQAGSALKAADKTQVARLIEVFQSESDPKDSISLLMLHIMRQCSRRELPFEARKLVEHLRLILEFEDKNSIQRAALKYLTLLKWVYETRPHKGFTTLSEYLQDWLKKEGRF